MAQQLGTWEKMTLDSIKSLQQTIETTGTSVANFAVETAPIIIQQLIMLNIAKSVLWIIAGLLLGIFGLWLLFTKRIKDRVAAIAFSCLSIGVSILIILPSTLSLIKWTIAPYIAVIEYGTNLAKTI